MRAPPATPSASHTIVALSRPVLGLLARRPSSSASAPVWVAVPILLIRPRLALDGAVASPDRSPRGGPSRGQAGYPGTPAGATGGGACQHDARIAPAAQMCHVGPRPRHGGRSEPTPRHDGGHAYPRSPEGRRVRRTEDRCVTGRHRPEGGGVR